MDVCVWIQKLDRRMILKPVYYGKILLLCVFICPKSISTIDFLLDDGKASETAFGQQCLHPRLMTSRQSEVGVEFDTREHHLRLACEKNLIRGELQLTFVLNYRSV